MSNRPWIRAAMLAGRDALIIAATAYTWMHWGPTRADPGLAVSGGLAVLTVLCGYLIHEWGHLAGAVAARASFVLAPTPWASPFLFRFDARGNSREQFAAMSAGGFISSAVLVALLLATLPLHALAGQLSIGLVVIGVIATIVLEVPEFLRVWRGQPIPTTAAYFSSDHSE